MPLGRETPWRDVRQYLGAVDSTLYTPAASPAGLCPGEILPMSTRNQAQKC